MSRFTLFVPGRPVPQGSKTAFISKSTGRPIVVDKDQRLPRWRAAITSAAIDKLPTASIGMSFPLIGPVGAVVDFYMDRPKGHFLPINSKRTSLALKPEAARYPATMPDIDKLLRAILDALTDARVWDDDGQVVWIMTAKHYADLDHPPGVGISIGSMKT